MGCPRRRRMTVHDHLMLMMKTTQRWEEGPVPPPGHTRIQQGKCVRNISISNRKKECQLIFFGQRIKMKHFLRNKQCSFCSLYFWKGSFGSHAVVTLIEEQSARVITIAGPQTVRSQIWLQTLMNFQERFEASMPESSLRCQSTIKEFAELGKTRSGRSTLVYQPWDNSDT